MKEQYEKLIELKDAPLLAFKEILRCLGYCENSLRYIYTGELSLRVKQRTLLDILDLAHQYGLADLESAMVNFLIVNAILKLFFVLTERSTPENVCTALSLGILYSL